jgi:phosphatidylserine/phosphatidylglycerophosphate/cardiolipin synthase-like enzyme
MVGDVAQNRTRTLRRETDRMNQHPSPSRVRTSLAFATLVAFFLMTPRAWAQLPVEMLCDNSFEDCRAPIIQLIRQENVGLDVSFWFMTDTRYSSEIIARWRAGVPVRILLDLRADTNYPSNANVRQTFISAGIPIRHKTTAGINHWKMILYAGQGRVHFSAANFANGSYSPVEPYTRYVDEAVYFTDDPDVVHTFMTKYDDLWTNTTHYQNLANVTGPLARNYPTYPLHSTLNFPPDQDYQDRVVSALRQETSQIDVVMFRITSAKVPDEMIRRRQAGLQVRMITDQDQYRNPTYLWHSYNVDRMHLAGIPIKWKLDEGSIDEDMHQKSIVLHSRRLAIFGSSNWTSSSSDRQREHNYFTPKPWIVDWFIVQFHRKWNNLRSDGTPIGVTMFEDFVPGWPETPVNVSPANASLGVGTSVALRWEGGWWAHKYDIYFGTTNPPPLIAQNYMPGSATAGVSSTKESFNPCAPPSPFVSVCPGGLQPGATYYWRVRGKTMMGDARAINGSVWSFTTAGGVPPPPAPGGLTAAAVSPTQINLSWTDVAGESGYKIERKLSTSSTWAQIATTGADATTYQNTSGLTANTTYNYRVRAWTSGGNSGYSNTATATTPATSPDTGRILADAYVRGGQYASTNFGRTTELIVKGIAGSDLQYRRESYLKLDISAVQPGDTVRLRLFGRLSDTRASSVTTAIYPLSSNSWVETSVTWNSGLTTGTPAWGTVVVSGTAGAWYEVDMTSQVQAQRAAGQTVIALALKNIADTLPYVSFSSRETSNSPRLVITAGAPSAAAARILADSYVRSGSNANTNYGAAADLVSKFSADPEYLRESYMKLNIGDVEAGDSVRLRLFGRLSDTRAPSVTTYIYAVPDTAWIETGITWNTKPPFASAAESYVVVSGTTSRAYEVDLTTFVQSQRAAGQSVICIALRNTVDTLPYVAFGSRESFNKPELIVQ